MSQPFRPSFPHPLPVFECRSQVGALKVRAKVPTGSGYDLHFEDDRFPVLSVGRDLEWPYLILHEIDQAVGYVVQSEPDGDVFFVRGDLFDALGFKAAQEGTDGVEPAAAFESGYSLVEIADGAVQSMDFGDAIRALKSGKRVARAGWNGKGMWLSLSAPASGGPFALARSVPAEYFWSENNRAYAEENGGFATVLPCITMKTATGEILMGWLASQSDMLAVDWLVVEAQADEVLPVGPATQAAREVGQ